MNKKLLATGILVVSGALIWTGCTPPAPGTSSTAPSTATSASAAASDPNAELSVAWNQAFYSANSGSFNGNNVVNALVTYMASDGFFYYDNKNKIVKNTSFGTYEKVSDDPLTIKETISPNAKWSDGTPVDAADVILTWGVNVGKYNTIKDAEAYNKDGELTKLGGNQVFFDAGSAAVALIKDIPKVSADGKEITFTYTKKFADWEPNLLGVGLPAHIVAQRALGVADPKAAKKALIDAFTNDDKAALSKIANVWNLDWNFVTMPAGKDANLLVNDGPMLITDVKKDTYVTMSRNANYAGDHKTGVAKITVRTVADASASISALANGDVQITSPQVTADILSAVKKLDPKKFTFQQASQASYEHIDLTFTNKGPFDKATYGGDEAKALKVRQAFLNCLPRQDIVTKLVMPLDPSAKLRGSFTTMPGTAAYDIAAPIAGMSAYDKVDIAKSKALLTEAGVAAPTVRFMRGDPNTRRANEYQLIKASCDQAGFKMVEMPEAKWSSKLGDKSYDAVIFAWSSTSTAVTESDANYRTGGGNNFGYYSNPKVDALFDSLQTETDPAKQANILGQVDKYLVDDAFGTVIFQFPSITAWESGISNVSDAPLSPNFFWNFWQWTVAK